MPSEFFHIVKMKDMQILYVFNTQQNLGSDPIIKQYFRGETYEYPHYMG